MSTPATYAHKGLFAVPARQAYSNLPRLPPKAEVETRVALKARIEARTALADLKAASEMIPNPAILINTISLLEARARSAIENIVTTTDRLFRFAQDDEHGHADPATKEALRYLTALRRGYDVFRSLFLGREDVYPRRFESRKTGKSGYSPACAHQWLRGICEIPFDPAQGVVRLPSYATPALKPGWQLLTDTKKRRRVQRLFRFCASEPRTSNEATESSEESSAREAARR